MKIVLHEARVKRSAKKLIHLLFLLLVFLQGVRAQNAADKYFEIKVLDAATKEVLPLSNVYWADGKGTTTDENGLARIRSSEDTVTVKISYIGYKTYNGNIYRKNSVIHIYLDPEIIEAEEIVINAYGIEDNVHSLETGVERLDVKEIEKLPALLGETDVLKSVQLLPGVQSGGEGSTGYFVRGGSVDQNLVLLDNIPIYNPSHLFGFFSVFNSSTIKNLELTISGFPARLGGRVSSVLDIETIDPDKNKAKFQSSIGTLAASASIESPIIKGKLSQQIAFRRSYVDVLARIFFPDNKKIRNQTDYYFGDVNYKLDFSLSERSKISATAYYGRDEFNYSGKNNFRNNTNWKNALAGIQWDQVIHPKLSQSTTLYWTDYKVNFIADLSSYYLEINSRINDLGAKSDWYYEQLIPGHDVSFGLQVVDHQYVPNNFDIIVSGEDFDTGPGTKLHCQELALYLEDIFELSDNTVARFGLRYNHYRQVGYFKRYISNDNHQIVDSVTYRNNEKVVGYNTLEPRFSIRHRLNAASSVKASIDFTSQFVHLAPISSVSLPTDVWVPSSEKIRPQKSIQYSLVYMKNLRDIFEISVAGFYKNMKNLIEYRNGVVLGYGAGFNYDDNFVAGNSESGGLEFQIKKSVGTATGWLSYTLSKTDRNFRELNEGKPFPAKYDRRHDLNLTLSYKLNKRWSISGLFVFGTGNALTLPVGRYVIDGNIVNDYGERNNFRMPPYHRMDLSATLVSKPNARWHSEWIFSIYNVYNRHNPYYIYFDIDGDLDEYHLEIEPTSVSLFPILPSITYKLSI